MRDLVANVVEVVIFLFGMLCLGIALGMVFLWMIGVAQAGTSYAGQYDTVDPKISAFVRNSKDARGNSCCNEADGHKCDGVENNQELSPCYVWDQEGEGKVNPTHRVRINVLGKWFEVPDARVRTEPNPTGTGYAWFYLYINDTDKTAYPKEGQDGTNVISGMSVPIDDHVIWPTDGDTRIAIRLFCFNLGGGS